MNGHDAYVFDDEADEDGVPNDQQLMEIDGMWSMFTPSSLS